MSNSPLLNGRPAEVGCLARAQAPIQSLLRPAFWPPCIRRLHACWQTWACGTSAELAFQGFLEALETCRSEFKFILDKSDSKRCFARVHTFTSGAEWLDILEIQFVATPEGNSIAKVCSPCGSVSLLLAYARPF
eukprot:m.110083 g.110083  ORF g.110083 m.110083 type:complete len:134 (-) comp51791_c0_seq2:845-1246(-)